MIVMQHAQLVSPPNAPVRGGMNVAPFRVAFDNERPGASALGFLQGGDFDHAVDNFGDSSGLVADWPTLKCGRQPYPLAARGSRGCFDYQPRDRPTSGLDNPGSRP